MVRIAFVCLGNICRSPTAEAVMRHLVRQAGLEDRIEVASAGLGDWHLGEPPDPRAQAAARRRGVEVRGAAKVFRRSHFAHFDWVLGMDDDNVEQLEALAPDEAARRKIRLLRSFDPDAPPGAEVPDPYYGGPAGFDHVVEVCEAACRGLLAHLQRDLGA